MIRVQSRRIEKGRIISILVVVDNIIKVILVKVRDLDQLPGLNLKKT